MPDAVPSETTLAIHNLQFAVNYAARNRTKVYVVAPTTAVRSALWKLVPGIVPDGTVLGGLGALLPNRSVLMVVAAEHPIPKDAFVLHLLGWSSVQDKSAARAWRTAASKSLNALRREF